MAAQAQGAGAEGAGAGVLTCGAFAVPSAKGSSFISQGVPKPAARPRPHGAAEGFEREKVDWRARLTAAQFLVLRRKATEPGGRLMYPEGFDDHAERGVYVCGGCNVALYTSEMKFDCGCGWPGFWANIEGTVYELRDADGRRCEILCAGCDGHLGHVFRGEGFGFPTDERHCVNSMSLAFVPEGKTVQEKILPTYNGPVYGGGGNL